MWMPLEQNSSWRQGGQPQTVNLPQDLGERDSRDGDLCELKGDVAAISHDLCADLNELVPQRGERLVFHSFGQRQGAQEVAEIVGEGMELQANDALPGPSRRAVSYSSNLRSRSPPVTVLTSVILSSGKSILSWARRTALGSAPLV